MDDEMVDILDEKGNPTGEAKFKREAHAKGLWHRAVHIWIYNSKGEVLLQKRAKYKKFYAGCWDLSAAGHVSAGQSFDQAAEREVFEELGLKVINSRLKKIEIMPIRQDLTKPFLCNREFIQVYLMRWDGNAKNLRLQKEEVERVKFMRLGKYETEIKDPEKIKKYTPGKNYFLKIIGYIREELKNCNA